MSAGQTAAKTASGGIFGALKGYALATFGTSAVTGIAAGFLAASLAFPPLGIAALVGAGIVAGAIAGFSVLGPVLGFFGLAGGAAKGARKGSEQSVQQARENARQQVVAQRQGMGMPPEMYNEMAGKKSHVLAEEQRRANNINNGQNVT